MSHTGKRFNLRRFISDTGFPDTRPKEVLQEELSSDAVLEADKITGEFKGVGGDVVLVGLSTNSDVDPVNVLNDNEKGVIIGYTESTTHFSVFHNDGTGPKVIYTIPDRFKDDSTHYFEIVIGASNVSIKFDGNDHILTTKIPSITDNLKLVNYGTY